MAREFLARAIFMCHMWIGVWMGWYVAHSHPPGSAERLFCAALGLFFSAFVIFASTILLIQAISMLLRGQAPGWISWRSPPSPPLSRRDRVLGSVVALVPVALGLLGLAGLIGLEPRVSSGLFTLWFGVDFLAIAILRCDAELEAGRSHG